MVWFESGASPKAIRVGRGFEIALGILFFLIVVIYAGVRGYNAYNHQPATQAVWTPSPSVNFPAVTFCPESNALIPLECIYEQNGVAVNDCRSTITTVSVTLEGIPRNCYTFNSDGSVLSTSAGDELAVTLSMNTTYDGVKEPILGASVFVHDSGSPPTLDEQSTFIAEVGHVTMVWLTFHNATEIDGTNEREFSVHYSAAPVNLPTQDNVIDVDFVYARQGYWTETEYYIYTPDQWIGEVGGFACLMMFLHRAVMFIIMFIAKKVSPAMTTMHADEMARI